jgi:hypothetical protein
METAMLLALLMLTPYLAIAASLLLIATVTVCVQFDNPPARSGFNASRQRRAVSHRGFVKTDRARAAQEAA